MTTEIDLFAGARWELDADRSAAEFHVGTAWGLATVHGRFRDFRGVVEPDGRIELVIEAASLHTRNGVRDRHLRSGDFFDVKQHPEVRFVSDGFERAGDGEVRVSGSLEAAGRKVQIELAPSASRVGDDALVVEAETTIDQRTLGMTYRGFGVRTPATVRLRAVLHRAAPAAEADR